MKQFFSLLFLTFCVNVFSQSSLTITSEKENVRFCVLIDDQQLHDFFETSVQINNLSAGMHYVRLVFEQDSVADYYRNILCTNGSAKIFKVNEKTEFQKSVRESGRAAGETLNIGEHDSTFNYLVDVYELDLIDKKRYTPSGNELEISTDQSLSTSIYPASKSKK